MASVKNGQGKPYNVQAFIVPEDEMLLFKEKCKENDANMSAVIRRFIRSYINDGYIQIPEDIRNFINERVKK